MSPHFATDSSIQHIVVHVLECHVLDCLERSFFPLVENVKQNLYFYL